MNNRYPLTSLFLYLTDRCNLRCTHCWISPKFSTQQQAGIPIEPLKKAVQEAKSLGLSRVKLTGGEPLLYRDLNQFLDFLGTENMSITIETNGTLLNKELLALFRTVDVSQVSVSLDAGASPVHDDIRGVHGCFDDTLTGLRLLTDAGINTQVIMTLQQKNRNEIPAVIGLCERFHVGSLKINHLLPSGRGRDTFRRNDHLSLDELVALYKEVNEKWCRPEGVHIIFDLPVAFRSIDDITHRGVCECAILNILGILANGDISYCGIGQTAPELRMGNILKHSIRDIWLHNEKLKKLRQSLPDKLGGICGQCIFKFQCLGECRAEAYAMGRDLFAPNHLCQSLFDSDRFPASRYITPEEHA